MITIYQSPLNLYCLKYNVQITSNLLCCLTYFALMLFIYSVLNAKSFQTSSRKSLLRLVHHYAMIQFVLIICSPFSEPFTTQFTCKQHFSMSFQVFTQIFCCFKCFVAVRTSVILGFDFMDSQLVLLHRVFCRECPTTHVTGKWLFSCVCSVMLRQICLAVEELATLLTRNLLFPCMIFHMIP